MKGFTQINEKISIKFSEKVLEIKKEVLSDFIYTMVTRTGFEPVNACVKGMWVNRFYNRPLALEEGFEPPTDRLTADCSTAELFKHF